MERYSPRVNAFAILNFFFGTGGGEPLSSGSSACDVDLFFGIGGGGLLSSGKSICDTEFFFGTGGGDFTGLTSSSLLPESHDNDCQRDITQ